MTKRISTENKATIYGVTQIVASVAILSIFGAGALLSKVFSWLARGSSTPSLVLFAIGVLAGALFLWKGLGNLFAAADFRKTKQVLGDSKYIPLSAIESQLGWTRRRLVKSLQGQMRRGYWPDACLDAANGAFMPRHVSSPYLQVDTGNPLADEMLGNANAQLHALIALSFSIRDAQIKDHIEQLLVITRQIYSFIRSNPAKARLANRFSDYHLPTAVSLLKDYQGLESQTVKGESIEASMRKIKESMSSFELAFRQQLDELYQDKAMGISVEIKVLHNTMDGQVGPTSESHE